MKLSIDIETKSGIDLTKCGVYNYIENENFEILLVAYAFDDNEVEVIDLTKDTLPKKLLDALINEDVVKYAFNANFERVCLGKYLGVNLPINSFKCTQAMSLRLGLSHSLESVSEILNLDVKKDKEGKALIKYFNTHSKDDDFNKWEKFKSYCKNDVIVERAIRSKVEINSNDFEDKLYVIDQKINDRGVYVDNLLIDKAISLSSYNEELLKDKLKNLTNIENIKSTIQVKRYLKDNHDLEVSSLSKESVDNIINTTKDSKLKEVLLLRKSLNKTSIKKYESMKRTVTKDNTIKGLFQYYGANKTGRWSGRLVQVQNLPQTNLDDTDLIRDILKNRETKEAYELIDLFYEDIQSVLSNLIRCAFIPKPNKKLIISDFSAIEARVLSYISNEKWRIDVFNTHGKIYEASASKMFNVDIDNITKDSPLRQKGKIAELALGYQGGVNAMIKMGGEKMGLSQDEMINLVMNFRNNNKNIVRFWRVIEEASIYSVKHNCEVKINNIGCELKLISKDEHLYIMLPSGRMLAYYKPQIEIDAKFNKEVLTYKSINQTTKKYEKTYTYGGKLTENVVQAISRDILGEKMINLDDKGYSIVMHVHDEVVLEVDEAVKINDINEIMEEEIFYLKGLKLKADTQISYYYKK